MTLTSSSLAEAAPLNNEGNDNVSTVIQAEVLTDRQQTEAPKEVEPVVKPVPVKAAKPKAAKVVQPKYPSDRKELLRLAGIPEYEWAAANEIISRESGWRHLAWNSTGSGAYGLCQSLPATKMASAGSDYMTNPVTQLKWCNEYAKEYGGWIKAAEYSRCIGRCYSTRVSAYVYKDHKWW